VGAHEVGGLPGKTASKRLSLAVNHGVAKRTRENDEIIRKAGGSFGNMQNHVENVGRHFIK
jgi:hypothetical protein